MKFLPFLRAAPKAAIATPKRKLLTMGAAGTALAVSLVGDFEGLRTEAYRDIVGVATVCYGETRGVRIGDSYTKEECDDMLVEGLLDFEKGMNACLKAPDALPVKVRVAMLSATFNVGVGGFCASSMRLRLDAGDTRGACDALLMWNKAGGKAVKGLTRRREAERKLCLEGVAGS